MSVSEIVSARIGSLWRESRHFPGSGDLERGEFLTMRDGSEWFHPYNGRAPRCVRAAMEDSK
jgi:hypothetical protein